MTSCHLYVRLLIGLFDILAALSSYSLVDNKFDPPVLAKEARSFNGPANEKCNQQILPNLPSNHICGNTPEFFPITSQWKLLQ